MDSLKIGKFITQKRKSLNLTQNELAEKIGVSNKTISKWECGKNMPDYSVIDVLCEQLGITPTELLNAGNVDSNLTKEESKTIFRIFNTLNLFETYLITILFVVFGLVFLILFQMIYSGCFKNYYDYSLSHSFDGTILLIIAIVLILVALIGFVFKIKNSITKK